MIKEEKHFYYKTGRFLQFYSFSIPIKFNVKHPKLPKHLDRYKNSQFTDHTPEEIETLRKAAARRAVNSIRRLIYGNMYNYDERPKFVTLTFDPKNHAGVNEIQKANHYFTLYRKRLNYHQGKYIPYIAVPERQENGNWHYHQVVFGMPYLPDLLAFEKQVWQYGNTNVKVINKTRGAYNYITKYISKSFLDPSLKGKKRYFSGLQFRPVRTIGSQGIEALLSPLAVKMTLPIRNVVIREKIYSNGIKTPENRGTVQEFILNY